MNPFTSRALAATPNVNDVSQRPSRDHPALESDEGEGLGDVADLTGTGQRQRWEIRAKPRSPGQRGEQNTSSLSVVISLSVLQRAGGGAGEPEVVAAGVGLVEIACGAGQRGRRRWRGRQPCAKPLEAEDEPGL